jgi:hypothetical protein
MESFTRRVFLVAVPGVCASAGGISGAQGAVAEPVLGATAAPGEFPRQDIDAVREVVAASHRDFDRVKELVTARPALARATYDWGFGDWETALGAASHTGRRQIAELLLEHGARPDIFAFAMLGDLAAVKSMIECRPGAQRIAGPHGISLLRHAESGGEKAAAVVDYLRALGDAGIEQESLPLSPEQHAAYGGTFEFAGGTRFEIRSRDGQLVLVPQNGSPLRLFHIGEHLFHPTGARAVRITFRLEGGRAAGVAILDGPFLHSAVCV